MVRKTKEHTRGRSIQDSPFMRRDVDVSIDREMLCLIGNMMGVQKCVQNETCWLWKEKEKECKLLELAAKFSSYLSRKGREDGRRRRKEDNHSH